MKTLLLLPLLCLLACVNGSPQQAHGRDPSRDKPMAKVKKKAASQPIVLAAAGPPIGPQGPPISGAYLTTDGIKSLWATNWQLGTFGITQGANTGGNQPSAGSTTFWPLWNIGGNNITTFDETRTANILTLDTTLTNLYFYCSVAAGATRSNILEVVTNGIPTNFKVATHGAVQMRATNKSDWITIQAGTTVGVRITTQGGSPSTRFCWALTCRQ